MSIPYHRYDQVQQEISFKKAGEDCYYAYYQDYFLGTVYKKHVAIRRHGPAIYNAWYFPSHKNLGEDSTRKGIAFSRVVQLAREGEL